MSDVEHAPAALEGPARAAGPDGLLRDRSAVIVGAYVAVSVVWILCSDQLLEWTVDDPDDLVRYSSFKGVAFVTITAALLYVLIRRSFRRLVVANERLAAHEGELRRIGGHYAALTHLNQATVRQGDRDQMLDAACGSLVDAGFAMAWIGHHDPEHRTLTPVAVAGDSEGHLDGVVVSTADGPEGGGPSGQAVRADEPRICNDLLNDPSLEPWRLLTEQSDLRATAVLPLHLDDELWGTLNVYAREVGFFREEETALLIEAASDISHALAVRKRADEAVTTQALAEQERRFSDAMIASLPGIVYFYDSAGNFLRWNQNFELVSGHTGEEIAGMHPLDFFRAEDRPMIERRIEETFASGEADVEADFVHRDGSSRPFFFTGRRVVFDDRTCLIGVGIDISERKEAERALQELNETLELRVKRRTDELRSALVRAEAADQVKSAFLATMSHELRTPLNSIIGFTGILLRGLAGPLEAEQHKQLGMVQDSARHLLELINDVLDLSKIEAGQLEVQAEPFEVGPVVERCLAHVRWSAEVKGLVLQATVPVDLPPILGDRRRVEQILLNLLTNAAKFTEAGGVDLRTDLVVEDQSGPWVRIRVIDTGIGIAEDDLASLFEPFRQIDSGLDRRHEGTGLGLAICRRLCELMGGRITATSVAGRGSEFTVVLPAADRSEP